MCVDGEKNKPKPETLAPMVPTTPALKPPTVEMPAPKVSALPKPMPAPTVVAPETPKAPKPIVGIDAEILEAMETDSKLSSLNFETLRWLYGLYGQLLVSEVIAIAVFQGTKVSNYIGFIRSMCEKGAAKPTGYVPIAEKKVQEEKRRQEQEKRQREEAAEATNEVEIDKIYNALSEGERNRLLDEAKESVKGMSSYHQRPFYLQYLAKEMLRKGSHSWVKLNI